VGTISEKQKVAAATDGTVDIQAGHDRREKVDSRAFGRDLAGERTSNWR
jgi:hypothetical protein